MAVEEMSLVTISGPEHLIEPTIQRFVLDCDFHLEDAIKVFSRTRELFPFESLNPYAQSLAKAQELMKLLNILPDYRSFASMDLDQQAAAAYIEALDERVEGLKKEQREKAELMEHNALLKSQLSHFAAFQVETGDLFAIKYLSFHFGSLPVETYSRSLSAINNRPDLFFVESGRDAKRVFGAYLCLKKTRAKADALMASLGFERMHIDLEGGLDETIHDTIIRLNTETTDLSLGLRNAEKELLQLREREEEKILAVYSWLRYESETFETLSFAGRRHGKFYLVGWAPLKLAKKYMEICEEDPDLAGFLTEPDEVKDVIPPPVKLKGGMHSIYEPFLEMYGLPAYKEIDPRPFLALTYTLLFGIMFGDVGQGLLLIATGLLLWYKKGAWLGRIIALCGFSATGFGFVYGSVFGNEELIPWGFHVLEKENTMQILIIAVALGAVLLIISMAMNMINAVRQKNLDKLLFSPNGIAGFVFYLGLAAAVVALFVFDVNLLIPAYILPVLVLPLVLIFFSGPLTKLVKGEKDWLPKSPVMFLIESFFEVFETLLSYVSNTVSFLRVGAFAISHAGMMMVVYLLAAGSDGGHSIPALIFGNLFVTALETMLVCIQVLRLEYYEMFGRFYEGGGKKFSPKTIDYRAAEQ